MIHARIPLNNAVIEGYLLTPQMSVNRDESMPLIVYTHGYKSQIDVVWPWAKQGAMVFGMDIRGCGESRDAVPQISEHGYVLTGIDSPDTSILRGAFCDFIRGIEVAHELLHGKQQTTVRRKLVTEGSGEEINTYIHQHPEQEQNIMKVLSYFDTMNFAPLINCPVLIGVGLQDTVVPTETVYAFINHLSCKKRGQGISSQSFLVTGREIMG